MERFSVKTRRHDYIIATGFPMGGLRTFCYAVWGESARLIYVHQSGGYVVEVDGKAVADCVREYD